MYRTRTVTRLSAADVTCFLDHALYGVVFFVVVESLDGNAAIVLEA